MIAMKKRYLTSNNDLKFFYKQKFKTNYDF